MRFSLFLLFVLIFSGCREAENSRTTIDLSGTWQFATDPGNAGIRDQWFSSMLDDSVQLPGTTDLNKKGYQNTDTTTMHLNRVFKYEGPAWYRKEVDIPESFNSRQIQLFLERSKSTTVWIDDKLAGGSALLQSPQYFDVSHLLTPGRHSITIRVDNSLRLTPYGNVHIYSDDTQTNWNGILGRIFLEAMPQTHISDIQVYPDPEHKLIKLKIEIENQPQQGEIDVIVKVKRIMDGATLRLKSKKYTLAADSSLILEYDLHKRISMWDDYSQPLYELTAIIDNGISRDSKTVSFGIRRFAVNGTHFTINGRKVFLRGKHDACVFPLTGHPPMDVEGWITIFKKAKSYGINHYRFHSWCPPDAAFTAADRVGIYLQAELPFWGGLESDTVATKLRQEGFAMLKSYANHPSFVLFSHGNEIWAGHQFVENNIKALKEYDSRPLYATGSNNNIGYAGPGKYSDFFVAARTPYSKDTILTHTRLTHAFADSREGGLLNTAIPSTLINFNYAISQINMPLISHEIGQYQIYPDYREIEKYTGILRAWNLEVFRDRLQKAGMMDQNTDFQKASGAWSALCYKAEMEAAARTRGMGGFQLLDLQDFPGQGTALVGILDAFMDDKDVIDQEAWLQSCNDVLLLPEFRRYCWTNDETFQAKLRVANYSNKDVDDLLEWEILNTSGKVIGSGNRITVKMRKGCLSDISEIACPFTSLNKAEKLTFNVRLRKSGYSNTYPIWVYPVQGKATDPSVMITDKLDNQILSSLNNGGKVLLFPLPDAVKENSTGGLFPPEFWNYGMFKGISEWVKKPVSPGTLGILTDPSHPALGGFPTDFHTNWQWFSIIKESRPLILDNTEAKYRPIVQVIDNLERNYKLGLIFEFKYGDGKLLICMSRLPDILDKPEALQLYNSLIGYMKSDSFAPDYPADEQLLNEILR